MELSIVIPAYAEEARLPKTLREIRPYADARFKDYEVLVVDDGSRDGTAAVCALAARDWPQLQCVTGYPHQGKGACVKRGCLQAKGENILVLDADHAVPIENLEDSLVARGRGFEIVAGMRSFSGEEGAYGMGRRIIGLLQLLLAHLVVFRKPVSDSQCGYKLFSRRSAQMIFSRTIIRGAMYDVEALFLAQCSGIPIYPQQVIWSNKAGSTNSVPFCILTSPLDLLAIRFFDLIGKYRQA